MPRMIKASEDAYYNKLISAENSIELPKKRSKKWLLPALEVQGNGILVIACKHSTQSYYSFQGLDTEN